MLREKRSRSSDWILPVVLGVVLFGLIRSSFKFGALVLIIALASLIDGLKSSRGTNSVANFRANSLANSSINSSGGSWQKNRERSPESQREGMKTVLTVLLATIGSALIGLACLAFIVFLVCLANPRFGRF